MKRLTYTLVFCLFLAFSAFGQAKYDLEFTNFSVSASTSPIVALDTVKTGQEVYLIGDITNHGPDNFSGGTFTFNVKVDLAEVKVDPDLTITVTIPSITATSTLSYFSYGKIKITKDIVPDVEKENIIIVWPDDFQDENNNNNLHKTKVFVTEGDEGSQTGILDIANTSFQIYPNPAQEFVNVQLTKTVTGMVTLTDITGKRLYEVNVRTADKMVTIPLQLDGENLSEGVYFINVTTREGREVQKLILTK